MRGKIMTAGNLEDIVSRLVGCRALLDVLYENAGMSNISEAAIIPCSNPAKPFNLLKGTLNEMALFIQAIIYRPQSFRIAFGPNHDSCSVFLDAAVNFIYPVIMILGTRGFFSAPTAGVANMVLDTLLVAGFHWGLEGATAVYGVLMYISLVFQVWRFCGPRGKNINIEEGRGPRKA